MEVSCSVLGQEWMDRSVAAIGATSGSVSALLLRLLSEGLSTTVPFPDCPICPDCALTELLASPVFEKLDIPSLGLGLIIGLLLGPLLDICFLARQAWRAWIRNQLSAVAAAQHRRAEPLYKLA